MYQAYAIALKATDAPKEDVERALLSAVDFAETPEDILHVAARLEDIGSDAAALATLPKRFRDRPVSPRTLCHGTENRTADGEPRRIDVGLPWCALASLARTISSDRR